jgi:hypothetical protein
MNQPNTASTVEELRAKGYRPLMATSIPPLVATKNSPTLGESYMGMKKERSFDLRLYGLNKVPKLLCGWGKSTWP